MTSSGHETDGEVRCGDAPHPAALATTSPAMQAFARLLADAARHAVPVLLVGERGTGRTTFARTLHELSPHAERPFVRVDCTAAPGDPWAQAHAARGGTLFLDDVDELSPALQAAALRLVADARALRFRIVASTRHDLEAAIGTGSFRKDLFYRLSVLEIRIPPLRERAGDIVPVARAILSSIARGEGRAPPELSPALERAFLRYAWPGNVQELRSVLERMVILSRRTSLGPELLPQRIAEVLQDQP